LAAPQDDQLLGGVAELEPEALAALPEEALDELIDLTAEFASSDENKFNLYQPTIIARHFHASTAKTRANFGGNRSSKTFSHIIDYACQFTGRAPESLEGIIPKHRLDPHRRLRLCMNDYPNNFMKVIWPYIKMLVPSDAIADVVKDSGRIKAITNRYGGFIEFMQYDQDTEKFQGASLHSVGYDEEPPEDKRKENLMRLADTGGEETFSLTPVSGAVRWLKRELYDRRSLLIENEYEFDFDEHGVLKDVRCLGLRRTELPDGNPNIHCFFSCIFDNPKISKDEAIRLLAEMPEDEAVMRGKGHFLFLGGLVYPMYNDATHVVPWFDWHNPREYTPYIFIDPHPRTPHAVSFFVVRKDGRRFQVDEIFESCEADPLAELIAQKLDGSQPEVIVCDPLAWIPDMTSAQRCFAWDLMDALAKHHIDAPVIKASKDLANGILNTKRELTPKLDNYGNKVPGFQVTENCANFRREIVNWSWSDWAHRTETKGPKQVPVDKDDHFMENLYRFINFNARYIPPRAAREAARSRSDRVALGASPVTGY